MILNRKKIIGAAYICMALAASVYATNVSQSMKDQCSNCSESNPVNFPDGGDGHPYKATNQDDCCTTACIVANPGDSDGAGSCALDCESA